MSKEKFEDILISKDGITKGPFGGDIKKEYFVPKGLNTYKVYEQSVVYNKDINHGNYYIDEERFQKLKKFEIKEGDILITGAGTLGELYEVPHEFERGVINQALIRIRLNEEKIYKPFFKYYFKWYLKNVVCRINGDSVIPNLPPISVLKATDIDLPKIEIQIKVANCLDDIEKQISINEELFEELRELEEEIFSFWFLQYEFPDENGNPYKLSGGAMVWNDVLNREIPKGWKVEELGEHLTSSRGISYNSGNLEGDGIPMINLASFGTNGTYKDEGIKNYSGEYPQEKTLKPYDLVMCNTQQTAIDFEKDIIGKAFLVPDIFEGDIVHSHHVTKITVKNEDYKYYLCRLFDTQFFHKYIAGFTNGTNILGLDFSGVETYKTEIPDSGLLKKFAELSLDIEKKKNEIIKENKELASLRDFLLPLLMNGQVTFKD